MKRFLCMALAPMLAVSAFAQGTKSFTLDDLMWSGKNYWNLRPEYVHTAWWGDRLVRLTPDAPTVLNSVTGEMFDEPEMLFCLENVNLSLEGKKVGEVRNLHNASFPCAEMPYALIREGRTVAVYDFKEEEVVRCAKLPSGVQDFAFAEGSLNWAYVKDFNISVQTDSTLRRVTTDGTREVQYGLSVHREEFGIDGGLFWNPQGTRLAFYRMDQSMVEDFPLLDPVPVPAEPAPEKYPMAGRMSHEVSIGVYDVARDTVVWLQTASPVNRYFTNIQWSPDGERIYVMELPRNQREMSLIEYAAADGRMLRTLYRETDERYVEPMTPIRFLPWDDGKFVVESRRDGFNHLYLYSTDGRLLKQLTKGRWEVSEFVGFNRKERTFIFRANADAPTRQGIYCVTEKGVQTRLTDDRGVHHATLSKGSGEWMLDQWSAPDLWGQIDVRATSSKVRSSKLSGYKVKAGAEANNLITSKLQTQNPPLCTLQSTETPWQDFRVLEYRLGTLTAADDTTTLYYRLVLPVDFDPAKRYPAVVYVYGGPHAHCVDESWHYASRPWETYMAQKGFVVFCMDNRGSEYRGKDFEAATYCHLGREEMKDQLRGVDFLKAQPFVDADRLGIHGWSFGGFMTSNLMCSFPDVFKVGVAGGPVLDWRLYEVMYGERYMQTPQENPLGYEEADVCAKASQLKGKLQVIVGLNDPTCVLQHSLRFLRAAIDADVQPDYFIYPSQGHNMNGHDAVHLHERITQYFMENL